MTTKPRNLNMFTAGQDTPLFSGVCQTIKASAPAPAPDPWQQTSFTDQVSPEPISLTPWPGVQIPEQPAQPEPQPAHHIKVKAQAEAAQRTLSQVCATLDEAYGQAAYAMELAAREDLDYHYPELSEALSTINKALNQIDDAGMRLYQLVIKF